MVYISTRNRVRSLLRLHVRASKDPAALAHDATLAVHSVNPTLAVTDVQTLEQFVDGAMVFQRMPARMLSTLGPLALLLAAIGIYSVIAYSVAQRTQEFGVRLTLGASPRSILLMVLAQGLRAILGGMLVGTIASYFVSRYFSPKMVGVAPGDLTVFSVVLAILTAVSLFACWWPAKRATRVDPIEALRSE
jgi:putative ABC transport system permease protein